MLVFAAHTPHSPLLLPEINTNQLAKVEDTRAAMQTLADELYAVQPETILLLSEHPTVYKSAFSVDLSDPYQFDLSEFGLLEYKLRKYPDIATIDRLQRSMRAQNQRITLTTGETLNYAAAIPLALLTERLPNVKIIPITYSELSAKEHFQFGQALKDIVMNSDRRIAVIAAGDSSHALTSTSPGGFSKFGEAYDEKIQELLSTKNTAAMLRLSQEMVEGAQETNYRVLTILFGLLERIAVSPQILSYEAPFGVGYLTVHFVLK